MTANRTTATSRDGTPIAFWREGQGLPLLLVHGATADHTTTWRFVQPLLAEHFTVFTMDRRGRGSSGDSPGYSLQREAEDIAAVVGEIGAPVHVLGHSFGGLCAIEAALLTPAISRLILYEGVPLDGSEGYAPGIIDRLESLLEAGETERMLETVFREVVGMPAGELELLRSQREAWAVRLSNARTLPREMRTEQGYVFEPSRFREMRAPTLLLVGAESPRRELINARGVAAALPDARIVMLEGQQHVATYSAPELLVARILEFLNEATG